MPYTTHRTNVLVLRKRYINGKSYELPTVQQGILNFVEWYWKTNKGHLLMCGKLRKDKSLKINPLIAEYKKFW